MTTFTLDFSRYPTPPGPGYGIKSLLTHTSPGDVIILRGNAAGFETEIQAIKDAGIYIDDQTIKVPDQVDDKALQVMTAVSRLFIAVGWLMVCFHIYQGYGFTHLIGFVGFMAAGFGHMQLSLIRPPTRSSPQ